MKKQFVFPLFLALGFGIILSCSKSSNLIPTGTETLILPETPANYAASNPFVDNNKATLGRVLFYDKHMSLNNSVACASCHKQINGFADNKAGSQGIENITTPRNSLAIQNLSIVDFGIIMPPFNGKSTQHLFWDNRENDLTQLMLRPIGNHVEMGIDDLSILPAKLNKLAYYKDLVQKAYGKDELDLNIMAEALAHFNASIRTVNSRFDKFIAGDVNAINAKEKVGFSLFTSTQYQCNSCHTSMLSGGNVSGGGSVYGGSDDSVSSFAANIGLNTNNADGGIGNVTGKGSEKGMFKIPDLHNVAVTAPYMHDGSKATLADVLDHYSANINSNPNLDSRLRNTNGSPKRMNITAEDKEAMIAFLNSLTDVQSLTDTKFSNPFIIKK